MHEDNVPEEAVFVDNSKEDYQLVVRLTCACAPQQGRIIKDQLVQQTF